MIKPRERVIKIILENISLKFETREEILDSINVEIPLGECIAIYGGDSSGKSLLLKIIAGLSRPTSGQVLYNNKNVNVLPFEELIPLKLSTAFCFENGGVMMNKTIDENLKLSLNYHNQWRSQRSQDLYDALVSDFKLAKFLDLKPDEVSPSVRKVTGIVRCFLVNPQIIFLDEPSLGIGEEAVESLKKWIKKFREVSVKDSLLLFSTQDAKFVESIGAKQWTLKEGKLDARAV